MPTIPAPLLRPSVLRSGLAAAVVVAAGVAGCSGGSALGYAAGSLTVDAGDGSTCLDADRSAGRTTITYGQEGLGNGGGGPLTLTDVDLRGADGLEVVEAYVVPVGDLSIGNRSQWPPLDAPSDATSEPTSDADGIRWSERQRVPGAVLPARADGGAWNLVLRLRKTHPAPLRFEAVEVAYDQDGRSHRATGHWAFSVLTDCSSLASGPLDR